MRGGVLRSTFLHLPGVGPITEAELWQHGIVDWSTFREERSVPGVSAERKARWNREIDLSEDALERNDPGYFARRLPAGEAWRLYPTFRSSVGFLDIETTGLSPYEGTVTVVTVHGDGRTRTFVADDDLEELPAFLRRYPVFASFNGIAFDVPFLQARFPGLVEPLAHIDLAPVLRRLGYAGGLKRIEQVLGLGDRSGVEGIHGIDAVRLWEAFRRGQPEALDRLVRYNRADTLNLEPLLDFAVGELTVRLLGNPRAAIPSSD